MLDFGPTIEFHGIAFDNLLAGDFISSQASFTLKLKSFQDSSSSNLTIHAETLNIDENNN